MGDRPLASSGQGFSGSGRRATTRERAAQRIGRALGLGIVVCVAAVSAGGARAEEEPSMLRIGLDGLPPGAYELRIEARLEGTGEDCEHRERILLMP